MSQPFDVFAPPGMFTVRGSCVSITETDCLYISHGSRAVTLEFTPLQWQLLSVGLTKLLSDRPGGPVTLDTGAATLQIAKGSLYVSMKASGRAGLVTVALSKGEANELRRAARRRSYNTHQPEGA